MLLKNPESTTSKPVMSRVQVAIKSFEVVLSGFFSSIGLQPYHYVTASMRKKARAVLNLLEIPHLADREMNAISSGESRRILIGRALVHDPLALLLDEPTNSLDLHAMVELRTILRKLAQSGTGILLVTHHLPDIIPEIDRVVFLRNGRVFADGDKAELLTAARLTELFSVPVELECRDGYYHMW